MKIVSVLSAINYAILNIQQVFIIKKSQNIFDLSVQLIMLTQKNLRVHLVIFQVTKSYQKINLMKRFIKHQVIYLSKEQYGYQIVINHVILGMILLNIRQRLNFHLILLKSVYPKMEIQLDTYLNAYIVQKSDYIFI